MQPLVFIAYYVRTGLNALNVISAALGTDLRTEQIPIRFINDRKAIVEAVLQCHLEGKFPVVVWSFYSCDADCTEEDLHWIQQQTQGVPSFHLAGGVHASAEPRDTLAMGFDLIALGEGEYTVVAIFQQLLDGRIPRNIQGTAYWEQGSFVSHGPGRRPELDEFPAVNLRYLKWNPVEITRGCIYACTFCQTPYLFKARFRHRSIANIKEHLMAMPKKRNCYVRYLSPTALSYGSQNEQVELDCIEELLAVNRETLGPHARIYFGSFPSEIRPEHISEKVLKILKKYVTNTNLILGGQSGSLRILEQTRRGHGVTEIIEAVRLTVAAGFRPDVDFLFGLPGESKEDQQASIRLAEQLVQMGARIHNHSFMPLPGTPLRNTSPEVLHPETLQMFEKHEGKGSMYGQWRKQLLSAQQLVRRQSQRPSRRSTNKS
jgi:B12-binding domain/radical SAM domain protein